MNIIKHFSCSKIRTFYQIYRDFIHLPQITCQWYKTVCCFCNLDFCNLFENKTIRPKYYCDNILITFVPLEICSAANLGWLSASSFLNFSIVRGFAEKPNTWPAERPSSERLLTDAYSPLVFWKWLVFCDLKIKITLQNC